MLLNLSCLVDEETENSADDSADEQVENPDKITGMSHKKYYVSINCCGFCFLLLENGVLYIYNVLNLCVFISNWWMLMWIIYVQLLAHEQLLVSYFDFNLVYFVCV